MRVILSHPYAAAVYEWFAEQVGWEVPLPDPGGSYYGTVVPPSAQHRNFALACLVIYDEIVLPAVDAPVPGVTNSGQFEVAELSVHVDWRYWSEAQELLQRDSYAALNDQVIRRVLARVPSEARDLVLIYAVIDALTALEQKIPMICAPGRAKLIGRLLELGVVPSEDLDMTDLDHQLEAKDAAQSYVDVTGLTFDAHDVEGLSGLKWDRAVRGYAAEFQKWFVATEGPNEQALWSAIAEARDSASESAELTGYFSATSRSLAIASLIPGVGLVTGPLSIATDYASEASRRRAERLRWYELDAAIGKYYSRLRMDSELRRRGLL